jgi:NAD(P)-dependent dehydrogenase (short-subunit alcohol dehydrogenase family)
MTQKKFLNNVVLIFGGTSGIGKATAQAFAAQGADVVVVGRRKQLGIEVVGLIEPECFLAAEKPFDGGRDGTAADGETELLTVLEIPFGVRPPRSA